MINYNHKNVNQNMVTKSLFHHHNRPIKSSYLTYEQYFHHHDHQSPSPHSNPPTPQKLPQGTTLQKQHIKQSKEQINMHYSQSDALHPTVKRQLFSQYEQPISKQREEDIRVVVLQERVAGQMGFQMMNRDEHEQQERDDGVIAETDSVMIEDIPSLSVKSRTQNDKEQVRQYTLPIIISQQHISQPPSNNMKSSSKPLNKSKQINQNGILIQQSGSIVDERMETKGHQNQHQNPYFPSSFKKKDNAQTSSKDKYELMKSQAKNYKIHELVQSESRKQYQSKHRIVNVKESNQDRVVNEGQKQQGREKSISLLTPKSTQVITTANHPQPSLEKTERQSQRSSKQSQKPEQQSSQSQEQQSQMAARRHTFMQTRAQLRQFLSNTNIRLLSAHRSLSTFQKDILDKTIIERTMREYDKLKTDLILVVEQEIDLMRQSQVEQFLRNKVELVPEFYEVKCNIEERMLQVSASVQLLKEEGNWKKVLNSFVLLDYEGNIEDVLQRATAIQSSSKSNVQLYFQQYCRCLNYDYLVDLRQQVRNCLLNVFGLVRDFKRQTMSAYKRHAQYIDS